jgi:hypothetical protein
MKHATKQMMVGVTLTALLATGCAGSREHLDPHAGAAPRAVFSAQHANQPAPAGSGPVQGRDGASAETVWKRYQNQFKAPAAPAAELKLAPESGQ